MSASKLASASVPIRTAAANPTMMKTNMGFFRMEFPSPLIFGIAPNAYYVFLDQTGINIYTLFVGCDTNKRAKGDNGGLHVLYREVYA